jgi:hypothetical protein
MNDQAKTQLENEESDFFMTGVNILLPKNGIQSE